MKVFAYLRFSSENQLGNTSIDTQREAIQRFVKTHPDLMHACIIERIDEAKTATTLRGRDGLAQILAEAERGDVLIVFKLDRLGRNLLDSLQVLKDVEERGYRVLSTCEPNEPVVRNIMLALAEEFSRSLGDRCRRALSRSGPCR